MARVRLQALGVAWLVLSACGGVYRRPPSEDEPSAGTGGAGGTDVIVRGGRGGAGPGGAGPGGVGAGGFGGAGADGGFAGFGGKVPDPVAGAAGRAACDGNYVSSFGGPRPDGPAAYMGCGTITDDDLQRRFADFEGRVPKGLYYQATDEIVDWRPSCTDSVQELQQGGGPDGMGKLLSSGSNEWEYSATFCSRGLLFTQKAIRCDYFDGVKVRMIGPSDYPLFASLLWWHDNYNNGDGAILGYSVQVGDATNVVELCTLSGSQGDFGLCDQLELYSEKYRISFGGEVTAEKPALLRKVQGKCH